MVAKEIGTTGALPKSKMPLAPMGQDEGIEVRAVFLTQGYIALVDDEDYEFVAAHKWCAQISKSAHSFRVYAVRRVKETGTIQYMHCVLFPEAVLQGKEIDHRDGYGTNNQRSNLRACTRGENLANRRDRGGSSWWRGVAWHKSGKKWEARISKGGKQVYLGCFSDEWEAAQAYNIAAKEAFGEFARLNTPRE